MALFRKKTNEVDGQEPAGTGEAGDGRGAYRSQPEKARKWFEHAKTAAMSYNYEYALSCFAHGIRLDPDLMSIHEAMYEAAVQYAQRGGKAASGKEIKSVDDGTPVGKFAAAEFAWMKDVANPALALKALEAAGKIGLTEYGHWAAGPALAALRRSKKPSKSLFLSAKQLFAQVGAWNEAITSGELALQLDPNDNDLAADLKDLAAQRAMDQGGYNEAGGQEGGFRKFVKDADRQRELQEEEALSGATSVEERNLLRARRAYEETPDLPDAVNKYAQLLKKHGHAGDGGAGLSGLHEGLRVRSANTASAWPPATFASSRPGAASRHSIAQIKSNGESDDLRAKLDAARLELRDLEAAEYRDRVVRYPTDRSLKYQLGLVEYDLQQLHRSHGVLPEGEGRAEAARAVRPHARPVLRPRELARRCDRRVPRGPASHRSHRGGARAGHSLRPDARADRACPQDERSIELAKEAREICSTIARKNISYRDIREQRQKVETLIKELSGDLSGGGDGDA